MTARLAFTWRVDLLVVVVVLTSTWGLVGCDPSRAEEGVATQEAPAAVSTSAPATTAPRVAASTRAPSVAVRHPVSPGAVPTATPAAIVPTGTPTTATPAAIVPTGTPTTATPAAIVPTGTPHYGYADAPTDGRRVNTNANGGRADARAHAAGGEADENN